MLCVFNQRSMLRGRRAGGGHSVDTCRFSFSTGSASLWLPLKPAGSLESLLCYTVCRSQNLNVNSALLWSEVA